MTMHLASTAANITRQQLLPGWRGVPLLVILTAALPAMAIAQDAPGAAPANETPTSIARLLAGRKAFAELTAKGKVKRDIKVDDQPYLMADGPSRVVLLKLPDYHEPYTLTISELPVPACVLVHVRNLRAHNCGARRRLRGDPDRARYRAAVEVRKHDEGRPVTGQASVYRIAEGRALRAALSERPLCRGATPMADIATPHFGFTAETTADGNIEAETGPITNK